MMRQTGEGGWGWLTTSVHLHLNNADWSQMSGRRGPATGQADRTHEPLQTHRGRLVVERYRQSLDHTQYTHSAI